MRCAMSQALPRTATSIEPAVAHSCSKCRTATARITYRSCTVCGRLISSNAWRLLAQNPHPRQSGQSVAKNARASTREYESPAFPETTSGHVAQVKRYAGSPQDGFREIGSSSHGSGKAGGNFSARRMSTLQSSGWPRGTAEDTHHSEAYYTADHLARPSVPPRGGVVVHQMKGGNDMCDTCRTGASSALSPMGSGHFVSYVGQAPFRSQGEWQGQKGQTVSGPGQVVRARPESMMRDRDRADHIDRAGFMTELRNPGSKKKESVPFSVPSLPPTRRGPKPPPPPPGAPGASSSSGSGSASSSGWARPGTSGRLIRT
jgi:hypothetical protein